MNFKILFLIILILAVLPAVFTFASTTDGTIDSTNKYAWAGNAGWINFGNTNGNVHVTDSALTGKAWSDNYGWINLNPTNGGVLNNNEGVLSGSAWAENLGWINFSGVIINSSGQFTGTAVSDNAGTVNFNCSNCLVSTDWRPASSRTVVSANAGSGSYYENLPTPDGGFELLINNGEELTKTAQVNISVSGNGDIVSMDISNYLDLRDFLNKPYQQTQSWVLAQGDGTKNVYVRLHDNQGRTSEVITGKIILNTKTPDIKIIPEPIKIPTEPKETVKTPIKEEVPAIIIPTETKSSSFFSNLKEKINSLLNVKTIQPPDKLITIPIEVPEVLKGKWKLLLIGAQNIKQR